MAQPIESKVTVGSKRFTESYVLGELINLSLRDAGVQSMHRQGLGNTAIVLKALTTGQIDIYPEYTGTIMREILKRREGSVSLDELNAMLAPMGLKVAIPLGFNNSYALAMKADRANALGLKKISDIAKLTLEQQAKLRIALSPEFKTRMDGWPALVKGYQLTIQPKKVLEHGLAYDALARGDVDIVDAYTTDAAIARQNFVLLEDDRQAFPRYDAVLLMRSDFDEKPLQNLINRLNEATMAKLNGQAEAGTQFEQVARTFLNAAPEQLNSSSRYSRFFKLLFGPDFFTALRDHVLLVAVSSTLALLVGIPLGVLAQRRPRFAVWILGAAGILQTIPSLALLTILIAVLDQIGAVPAVIALFLYGLLPIVNATHIGLLEVPANLKEAALALGCSNKQLLLSIELPSARSIIMTGLASATVIGVGTCTLAALVGAGGFGDRIVAGLAVNDHALMLAGAIPAAILALLAQALLTPKRRGMKH
ncbi:glycine betaine ABC transporter substrate-binding protein [Polynucleobacter sp.]|uniref:glycine betaine ABC transporter substrate-binding protein n=1 Tax=Polynucleobacter sp. TaxID=2029855 RepID=UPI0027342A68|nr:glycine betaine ABC transporter substrate-binding protein [Polynucleobacter sp.]MDP3122374.1 glycine betaine ABC transporter substrate-binding protein [Polynucleobacter sp.]